MAIVDTTTDYLAVPVETDSVYLSIDRAEHINRFHHCEMYRRTKSQFTRDFNLTHALVYLTDLTFQDSDQYEIVEEGFSYWHGSTYMYRFHVDRIIGYSIVTDSFTKDIGIFYSYSPLNNDQFHIVTAFPY